MSVITDDDIRRVISQRAFQAGIQYQQEGRVHDLRKAADGTTIEARVAGSGRSVYRQTIRLMSSTA